MNIFKLLYSARERYKRIRSKIILLRLEKGLYRKAELPEYDFNALNEKYPYREPCCVSDDFVNAPYDGKTNLSIIVPLYNSSAFIERLAGQLMNQKTKYQYEIIFVDDGSTDDTADKLRKIMVGGGGIRFIQQENKGAGGARNTGLEVAVGEYIAFVDSDDEVTELFIEKVLDAAYSDDADIVKCKYAAKLNGKIYKTEEAWGYVWGGVYNRNIFRLIRFPEHFWYEDMINPFIIASQSQKNTLVPEVLCFKNKHNGSLSNIVEFSSDYKCLDRIYLTKILVDAYYKLGLKDEDLIFRISLYECSGIAVRIIQRLDTDTRKQAFLALHEIICSFKHKPSGLTQKQQIFYNALMSKDFTAWNLAAKL